MSTNQHSAHNIRAGMFLFVYLTVRFSLSTTVEAKKSWPSAIKRKCAYNLKNVRKNNEFEIDKLFAKEFKKIMDKIHWKKFDNDILK